MPALDRFPHVASGMSILASTPEAERLWYAAVIAMLVKGVARAPGSWAGLLRDARRCAMGAPVLAISDAAERATRVGAPRTTGRC